jgi:methylated-DNA-protein-cysteine methyltransferase-like protein
MTERRIMRFTSPPNQQAYYAQVWELVRLIPEGKVATYGQIAKMLPPPQGVEIEAYAAFGPRWVGGAMANCPDDVPWQRVINSKGEISQRPGAQRQKELLLEEGVVFNEKGRIDLKKYGWGGDVNSRAAQQPTLFDV